MYKKITSDCAPTKDIKRHGRACEQRHNSPAAPFITLVDDRETLEVRLLTGTHAAPREASQDPCKLWLSGSRQARHSVPGKSSKTTNLKET